MIEDINLYYQREHPTKVGKALLQANDIGCNISREYSVPLLNALPDQLIEDLSSAHLALVYQTMQDAVGIGWNASKKHYEHVITNGIERLKKAQEELA